jgi:hypothetical protein
VLSRAGLIETLKRNMNSWHPCVHSSYESLRDEMCQGTGSGASDPRVTGCTFRHDVPHFVSWRILPLMRFCSAAITTVSDWSFRSSSFPWLFFSVIFPEAFFRPCPVQLYSVPFLPAFFLLRCNSIGSYFISPFSPRDSDASAGR